jgi:MYXO-CTERM domain-containing protein
MCVDDLCRSSRPCPENTVCEPLTGRCVLGACFGVMCPDGERCVDGNCFADPRQQDAGSGLDGGTPRRVLAAGSGCLCAVGPGATRTAGGEIALVLAALGVVFARRTRRARWK